MIFFGQLHEFLRKFCVVAWYYKTITSSIPNSNGNGLGAVKVTDGQAQPSCMAISCSLSKNSRPYNNKQPARTKEVQLGQEEGGG